MSSNTNGVNKLALEFESDWNLGDDIGSIYKGWFVPPADTRYRFYQSCDNKCRLWFAPCPDTTDNK